MKISPIFPFSLPLLIHFPFIYPKKQVLLQLYSKKIFNFRQFQMELIDWIAAPALQNSLYVFQYMGFQNGKLGWIFNLSNIINNDSFRLLNFFWTMIRLYQVRRLHTISLSVGEVKLWDEILCDTVDKFSRAGWIITD